MEETSLDAPIASLEFISHGVFDVLGTPWEGTFFFAHEVIGEYVPEKLESPIEWAWSTIVEMATLASLPGLLIAVAEGVVTRDLVTRVNSLK